MELSSPPSSFIRISATSHHHRFSPCQTKIRIKPTCSASHFLSKCTKSLSSPCLYSHQSRSKLTQNNVFRRNSIWACSQVGAVGPDPILKKVSDFKDACWRFLRPHTIRGTTLGSIALGARALIENTNLIKWSLVLKAFSGLIALICGNGYISTLYMNDFPVPSFYMNDFHGVHHERVCEPLNNWATEHPSYVWDICSMFCCLHTNVVTPPNEISLT